MSGAISVRSFESTELLWIGAAGLLALTLSAAQSFVNARHGTDHAAHSFLVRAIRANGFRFFVRIPGLLNEAYIGALPLYLHRIFAYFPDRMRIAEKLLNPAMNALHVCLVAYLALRLAGESPSQAALVPIVVLLFALTPQFTHALSARNFGLSARSIGLILLTVAVFGAERVGADNASLVSWGVLVGACYLIWAFSTFAMQAMVILATLLAVVTGRPYLLGGAGAGLALFVAVHPRYSLGYLYHTYRFIRAYATELAPVYVLARRYSIWRDLVRDIWLRFRQGPTAGFRYAYENSLLIVVLLNPLLIVAVIARPAGVVPVGSFAAFACDVALCGGAAMLLTSFRATRFLGEPERYVEAVTPWSTLGGAMVLLTYGGEPLGWGLVAAFLMVSLAQIQASRILARYLDQKPIRLAEAEDAIRGIPESEIVCCSNNEQLTKLLMHNDWKFSYCFSLGHGYCGMPIGEAFAPFPFLTKPALEKIIATYRVNVCALDRTRFETIFETWPDGLHAMRPIFESEALRVLFLEWRDQPDAVAIGVVASTAA